MMSRDEFRAKLKKIMPGYQWTVHRAPKHAAHVVGKIVATGTQTSGFNRLSTLEVTYTSIEEGDNWFEVRSAGYGLRAPWLGKNADSTLARALRGLQEYYQREAATYGGHARALEAGRAAQDNGGAA
jgi:hypothetical protein